MTIWMAKLRRGGQRRATAVTASALLVATGAVTALAAPAQAALADVGPRDAGTGFPTFYTDSRGTSLQLCLDGPPLCLAARADLIDGSPPTGDGEAFYYEAAADVGPVTVANALEAAYFQGGVDQEQTFMRTQVSAQKGGLTPGGRYTVRDPYGTLTCTATSVGEIRNNQCRTETPPFPLNFTAALGGRINPFLTWDPTVSDAPLGYIGDGVTPHKVVGSSTGFNKVTLDGPAFTGGTCNAAGVCHAETDLFVVQGKLATGTTTPPPPVTPPPPPPGPGPVPPPQAVTVPGAPGIGLASPGARGGALTAIARWSVPTSNGGTAITGYVVQARRLNGTVARTSANLARTTRSFQMALPSGSYKFTVRARNARGLGTVSGLSNTVAAR